MLFFNEKQDLPRFQEFVNKIKLCKGCEIVLDGLITKIEMANLMIFSIKQRSARTYYRGIFFGSLAVKIQLTMNVLCSLFFRYWS